jgi:hypothetical protein
VKIELPSNFEAYTKNNPNFTQKKNQVAIVRPSGTANILKQNMMFCPSIHDNSAEKPKT